MDSLATELAHPLRFRIWELYERDPARSLAAVELHRDLAGGVNPTIAEVTYHLLRLQHKGLGGAGSDEFHP